ncbi:MAG: general secretion pathway protein GspK [Phycisphaeraceae bacterium]|nr:general secretion pathway protein GspK [Phycisphaeraceae bacterium]
MSNDQSTARCTDARTRRLAGIRGWRCLARMVSGFRDASGSKPRVRGVVLIVVLVLTVLAAMVGASLMYRVSSQARAAVVSNQNQHAYTAALSGVQTAVAALVQSGLDPAVWYDNPELFRNVLVSESNGEQWFFTVFAPSELDPESPRYGLTDESGKISINHPNLGYLEQVLLELPGMDIELVDSLLDYRDPDDTPRPHGAEQDYYDRLPVPYLIPNGPLATVDELLLVRGFTGELVYGDDINLSGMVVESDSDDLGPDFAREDLSRGIRAFLTVFSYGPNLSSDNRPRVNLNGPAPLLAASGLSQRTRRFIALVRADGTNFTHPSQLLGMEYQLRQNSRLDRRLRAGAVIRAQVDADELELLMDRTTTSRGRVEVGLVNVNSASAPVLAAIPGIGPDLAQQIVEARLDLDPSARRSVAWLYTMGVVDAPTFQEIAPFLTARGYQYHIRSIGFSVPGGQYRVIEAVVDVARGEPRIIYMRDLTRLGMPIPLDVQALEVR